MNAAAHQRDMDSKSAAPESAPPAVAPEPISATSTETSNTSTLAEDPTQVLTRDPITTGRDNLVDVPVPVTQDDLDTDPSGATKAKDKLLGGLKKLRGDKGTAIGKVKVLRLSKEDYAKYWAKDEEGNYIGTEPEGEGRRLWADELKEAS